MSKLLKTKLAEPTQNDFLRDVINGLSNDQKTLPCKYFYDARGSRLFDQICELEEYYPTRTEMAIMTDFIEEIGASLGPHCRLVEFGSGSSVKIRMILDHMEATEEYIPIEISREHMESSVRKLQEEYPDLRIRPICADYLEEWHLPERSAEMARQVFYFPGSTIGNFDQSTALEFLRRIVSEAEQGDLLLIGVDRKKDPEVLHAAYNDADGVTAAFNMNLLERINRELDGDFDLSHFYHEAIYNADAGRVEMHLVSKRAQKVSISGHRFEFEKGESIHTESSHKYHPEEFLAMAEEAGFRKDSFWTDARQWFSLFCLKVV